MEEVFLTPSRKQKTNSNLMSTNDIADFQPTKRRPWRDGFGVIPIVIVASGCLIFFIPIAYLILHSKRRMCGNQPLKAAFICPSSKRCFKSSSKSLNRNYDTLV